MTTLGIVTAGAVGLTTLSKPSSAASIEFNTLNIPDRTFTSRDGTPARMVVFTDVRAQWKVDSTPASADIYLFARDDDGGFHELATNQRTDVTATGDVTVSLVGNLLDADFISASDMAAPGAGEQTATTATLGVLVQVSDADGNVLVDADATREVTLTITEDAISAQIGGSGDVVMQDTNSTTTPTRPA